MSTTRAHAHLGKLTDAEEWCVATLLAQGVEDPESVVRWVFGTAVRADRIAQAVRERRTLQ